jgi:1,2-diacylglycerol 3-beta-galactosyltransferase
MTKKIVIFFSDAGGGHRSAGEAIIEALKAQHGVDVQITMVDGLKQYTPYPFNRFPDWYPAMIRGRRMWKYGYDITDGRRRARLPFLLAWPCVRGAIRRMVADHPADVYVAVHWIYLIPLLRVLGRPRPPVITVVTDLISIHAWWCYPHVDMCIVPTQPARNRVVGCGMAAEKVHVVGLPVAARFCQPPGDKAQMRAKVGWGTARPVVLVVSGGDGMGPLYEISQAISASGINCELAVVAGRNLALQKKLQAATWNVPVHIYGFVNTMPDLMQVADIIITKAGPGTICEAFNAGLPIVLYDYLPGQEAGNVGYVVDNGAGVFADNPRTVVVALDGWIGANARPSALAQVAANSKKLARPEAAKQIAELIWKVQPNS